MDKAYLLAEQTIDEADLRDLTDWLRTNPWLTQNTLVAEFERRWASWLGVRHAAFVNSGSSANLLMYAALAASERLRNRKVIVPAVCWSTTVAPAVQLGFEPLMCDADADTFGIDPNRLEELLARHDAATVVIVHVLGVPPAMDDLLALQRRFEFALLEDACAAAGSRFDGRLAGSFGTMSSFSFFYGHHLSTIEGGMVCTDDDRLHELVGCLRSHGWAKALSAAREAEAAAAHHVLEFNRPFTFYVPGFNLRSTEINARIGLSQLRRLDQVVATRIENHLIYQARFAEGGAIGFQRNPRATICSIAFGALAASAGDRDRIAAALDARRIETRPLGGGNMSRQPFWAARYGTTALPVADRVFETAFQLPNHARLARDDVHVICDTVLAAARAGAAAPRVGAGG